MAEEVKFTPGPWKILQGAGSDGRKGRGIEIGDKSYWIGLDAYNAKANAHLIAAAPELATEGQFLLDRLDEFANELLDDEMAHQFYGHVSPALARFRQALSRARGGE